MQREFTAIPSNWSVGQTIDYLRDNKDLPEEFLEIFIVDNEFKPIGTVPSSKVLRTPRDSKMISIMSETQLSIPVDMDKEKVGHLFENYNLNSACVVDKNNKLVGMITSDDVLTVLKEEAEEDALRLAGVGDEKISIVGSWAIPEFGTIAVMILVVAIVSIIIVSAKTKLSLVPRY